MKSIVCINHEIPTVHDQIDYLSSESLRDYDIAIFDPAFPNLSRIEFSGGGSCLAIEATEALTKALAHWSAELRGALQSGKTAFILLNEFEQDSAATGSSMKSRNQRTYNTKYIENYSAIPVRIDAKNAKGRKVNVKDGRFRNLYDIIAQITEYRVILTATNDMEVIFSAKDGAAVGSIIRPEGLPGSLVLLPYFSFDTETFTEDEDGRLVWTDQAIQTSHALIGQILAIDKTIRGAAGLTPPPNWIVNARSPALGAAIDVAIADIDAQIEDLNNERSEREQAKSDLAGYTHLLYETGKPLERAITKTLQLLGYEVDTLRIGDLEIDHVIVGPSGKRMIGEAEGKDTSAIDIGKFRQLASNIQEDFAREKVDAPAKGLLFGNGYRLMPPENRGEQFTRKSLTNALLHGTALIRTADLYPVAVHLLDHPEDDDFRTACRAAIEDTAGAIVSFPNPA
ncbi:hypothetical protein AiwAL_19865 [Acidiphilium sp. AL]|uniref:hypothetical protein n=1 Tax=Acidiphilium sp. AL TaxID=2871704 RepID=UPI0021CB3AAB|nr:hypothetical protein [Acidiphilium sp. AL]MCU4162301.1 hypothetical protein [Acidiphilium sp. AL]